MKWNTGEPPKEANRYLVTIEFEDGELDVYTGLWVKSKYDGKWFWHINTIADGEKGVIAWQELPEPYEATE